MRTKVIATMMLLAALFVGAGQLAAQNRRCLTQEEWLTRRAECLTDRMVCAYGLNGKQKEALQKANEEWLRRRGDATGRRAGQCGWGRRGYRAGCCGRNFRDCPYYGENGRAATADTKKWEAACKQYDGRLKQIMTKEQYESYMAE